MQKFVTTGRAQSKDSLLCIEEMSDQGMKKLFIHSGCRWDRRGGFRA